MADAFFNFAFRICENVTKAALDALTSKGGNKYFTKTSGGDVALQFNGFRINSEKVELLFNGEAVAYMVLPDLYAGDTLTVDGRNSMIGKYKFTITGA